MRRHKMWNLFIKKKILIKTAIFLAVSLVLLNGPASADYLRPSSAWRSKNGSDIGSVLKKSETIGFVRKYDPAARVRQIRALLSEIDNELEKPGTGNLPTVLMISDFHGAAD